jgi:hypothetical protein
MVVFKTRSVVLKDTTSGLKIAVLKMAQTAHKVNLVVSKQWSLRTAMPKRNCYRIDLPPNNITGQPKKKNR